MFFDYQSFQNQILDQVGHPASPRPQINADLSGPSGAGRWLTSLQLLQCQLACEYLGFQQPHLKTKSMVEPMTFMLKIRETLTLLNHSSPYHQLQELLRKQVLTMTDALGNQLQHLGEKKFDMEFTQLQLEIGQLCLLRQSDHHSIYELSNYYLSQPTSIAQFLKALVVHWRQDWEQSPGSFLRPLYQIYGLPLPALVPTVEELGCLLIHLLGRLFKPQQLFTAGAMGAMLDLPVLDTKRLAVDELSCYSMPLNIKNGPAESFLLIDLDEHYLADRFSPMICIYSLNANQLYCDFWTAPQAYFDRQSMQHHLSQFFCNYLLAQGFFKRAWIQALHRHWPNLTSSIILEVLASGSYTDVDAWRKQWQGHLKKIWYHCYQAAWP